MKTRVATELALSLLLAACGLEKSGPHFPHKSYGKTADALPQQGADEPVIVAETPTSDVPVSTVPEAQGPAPAADPAAVGDDPTDTEVPTLAADALIKKSDLRSYFDEGSARGIKNGKGYKGLGLAAAKIKANLTSQLGDGMVLSQTFGDGVARSLATQAITNSAGDKNRTPGQPTASTLQSLYRINSNACPGVFLCIDKLVSQPHEGGAVTSCFSSPFPYGALPNYKEADFEPYLKDYGPFTVTAYPGAAVDCEKPGVDATATETVTVTAAKVDPVTLPFKLHSINPLAAQLAIALTTERTADDLEAPYADETVSLPHTATYVMNSDNAEYLALVIGKRQSIDIAAQVGGGILGGIAGAIVGLDGVEVDLHFELCANLLKPEVPGYCPDLR